MIDYALVRNADKNSKFAEGFFSHGRPPQTIDPDSRRASHNRNTRDETSKGLTCRQWHRKMRDLDSIKLLLFFRVKGMRASHLGKPQQSTAT